jgi:hypothetical protein
MAWSRFLSVPVPPGQPIKALWRRISNSFRLWPDRGLWQPPAATGAFEQGASQYKRSYSPLNPFDAHAHPAYN